MKSAQPFYGDQIAGVLIENESDGDLLYRWLRHALG